MEGDADVLSHMCICHPPQLQPEACRCVYTHVHTLPSTHSKIKWSDFSPTNKMTDSNFKLVLGKIGAPKDQQLFPSLLPPQLYKSQQGSRGRWCPEAGLPPQGASQAQGETGLCDCQQVRRVLFQKQLP